MNKKLRTSLFDDLNADQIQNFMLWKKQGSEITQDQKIIYKSILYRKSKKTDDWKEKQYALINDRLYCYDNASNKSYIELDNVRLEKIRHEEKNDLNLKYGLRLTHNYQYSELFTSSREILMQWYEQLKNICVLTTFHNDYSTIKLLGKGNFARVYYSKSKINGSEYAVKAFEKDKFQSVEVDRVFKSQKNYYLKQALMKEISILRKMNQKCVIKMYEVYENEKYIFLVKELLKGGELFHRLKKLSLFDEKYTKLIMYNLLEALAYIHQKNIMHRDLKPENLILRSKHNDHEICIADFGLADYYNKEGKYQFKRCGTPGYVAPEVLQDLPYDFKIDVFSAGVIMFLILSGVAPFKGTSYDNIVQKNYNCEIDFTVNDMDKKISPDAMDLLKNLLQRKRKDRYSAEQALKHAWFQKFDLQKSEMEFSFVVSDGQDEIKEKRSMDMPKLENQSEKKKQYDLYSQSPIIMGNYEMEKESPELIQLKQRKENMYKQGAINIYDMQQSSQYKCMKDLTEPKKQKVELKSERDDEIEDQVADESTILKNMQNLQQYDFQKKTPSNQMNDPGSSLGKNEKQNVEEYKEEEYVFKNN